MPAVFTSLLLAASFAGCSGEGSDPNPSEEFDDSVPHCVGECGRLVDGSGRAWEPFIAVDPKDAQHIVIAHAGLVLESPHYIGRGRVSVSEDGGSTWQTSVIPSGRDVAPTHPLAPFETTGQDPGIVFLPDGTLVMTAVAANFVTVAGESVWIQGQTIYTLRSTDGGRTWDDVRIVDSGEGVQQFGLVVGWRYNGRGWLTVAPDGTLLLVWMHGAQLHPETMPSPGPEVQIVFSTSEDAGLTWAPARVIDGNGFPLGGSTVIGRDGTWYVGYYERDSGDLRFAQSRDRGETWQSRTFGQTSGDPVLAAQRLVSGVERLLLAYPTVAERGLRSAINFTWSDDAGATWAPPVSVGTLHGEATMPNVVAARGDAAWLTFFDVDGPRHSRYLTVKVVDGIAGEPLVLDEMDTVPGTPEQDGPGEYMGLAATPEGEALVAWVTFVDGEFDVVWSRVTGGDNPIPRAPALPPPGLDEPIPLEFTGHLNAPYYCLDPHAAVEEIARDQAYASFEFDVPADTRFVNGALSWETTGPTPETSDLDVVFTNENGGEFDPSDSVPETFDFELREGDQGRWTAHVFNCQNPPTDFTLEIVLS